MTYTVMMNGFSTLPAFMTSNFSDSNEQNVISIETMSNKYARITHYTIIVMSYAKNLQDHTIVNGTLKISLKINSAFNSGPPYPYPMLKNWTLEPGHVYYQTLPAFVDDDIGDVVSFIAIDFKEA